MNKEDIKFRIDQLRKDKMIYAIESVALTFICELGYVLYTILFSVGYSRTVGVLALVLPLGYFIYMALGNYQRYQEIKKLEKKLYK